MRWERFNEAMQTAANVGVVIGLMLVALQIRDSSQTSG